MSQSPENTFFDEPPHNSLGGKTLIVDVKDRSCFQLPSEALSEAGPQDYIFIRPGSYEDRLVRTARLSAPAGTR